MPIRLASQRHQPAHALGDEVVACFMRPWPGLAEAGDRAVNKTRIGSGKAGVVEAEFGKAAGLEILDDHVSFGAQPLDPSQIAFNAKIGDNRALAAIASVVIGSLAAHRSAGVRPLHPRRPP